MDIPFPADAGSPPAGFPGLPSMGGRQQGTGTVATHRPQQSESDHRATLQTDLSLGQRPVDTVDRMFGGQSGFRSFPGKKMQELEEAGTSGVRIAIVNCLHLTVLLKKIN